MKKYKIIKAISVQTHNGFEEYKRVVFDTDNLDKANDRLNREIIYNTDPTIEYYIIL